MSIQKVDATAKFARMMAEARKKKGMTQAELAAVCDFTRTTVTHMEAGYQRVFFEQAVKIARILELDLGEFSK